MEKKKSERIKEEIRVGKLILHYSFWKLIWRELESLWRGFWNPWREIQFRGWNNTSLVEIGECHSGFLIAIILLTVRRKSIEVWAIIFSLGLKERRVSFLSKIVWLWEDLPSWVHHSSRAAFHLFESYSFIIERVHLQAKFCDWGEEEGISPFAVRESFPLGCVLPCLGRVFPLGMWTVESLCCIG